MIAQAEIDKLLNTDLFVELGMERLSPEERISFLESFGGVIEQRTILRLVRELNEEQKNVLNEFLSKSDDSAALDAFLKTQAPDLGRLVSEETANYKKELLAGFRSMAGAVDINE